MLLVGLGNPGSRYEKTRHNIGFMVADALAPAESFRDRFSGRFAELQVADTRCYVLKPGTFMNHSGRSVREAMSYFRIEPPRVVVIHDELDLPFGQVRLKFGGGEAGHNGLRSITEHLATKDYFRLRMGIGRPPKEFTHTTRDFVLDAFAPNEADPLRDCIERGVQAVELLAKRGAEAAMNEVNRKVP